jgi:hypothetical protein
MVAYLTSMALSLLSYSCLDNTSCSIARVISRLASSNSWVPVSRLSARIASAVGKLELAEGVGADLGGGESTKLSARKGVADTSSGPSAADDAAAATAAGIQRLRA